MVDDDGTPAQNAFGSTPASDDGPEGFETGHVRRLVNTRLFDVATAPTRVGRYTVLRGGRAHRAHGLRRGPRGRGRRTRISARGAVGVRRRSEARAAHRGSRMGGACPRRAHAQRHVRAARVPAARCARQSPRAARRLRSGLGRTPTCADAAGAGAPARSPGSGPQYQQHRIGRGPSRRAGAGDHRSREGARALRTIIRTPASGARRHAQQPRHRVSAGWSLRRLVARAPAGIGDPRAYLRTRPPRGRGVAQQPRHVASATRWVWAALQAGSGTTVSSPAQATVAATRADTSPSGATRFPSRNTWGSAATAARTSVRPASSSVGACSPERWGWPSPPLSG